MGNYELLKAAINEVIKANGRQEITGEVLNQVLLSMVNSLGAGYQCMGVATPSTNPGTPDQNVFYFATQAGTYTNFDAIVLQAGISVLMWDGDWASQTWFTVDSEPTNNSQNLIASGAVFNALKLDGGAYDVTAHNSGATFASLSELLNSENLNTLIPSEIRHGGMSIKFVQSSDNKYVKYVQYRYMGTETTGSPNPFLDTANWQSENVDKTPTAGSTNLVESGGVDEKKEEKIYNSSEVTGTTSNSFISKKFVRGTIYRITILDGALGQNVYLAKDAENLYLQKLTFKDSVSYFVCNVDNANYIYNVPATNVTLRIEENISLRKIYDAVVNNKENLDEINSQLGYIKKSTETINCTSSNAYTSCVLTKGVHYTLKVQDGSVGSAVWLSVSSEETYKQQLTFVDGVADFICGYDNIKYIFNSPAANVTFELTEYESINDSIDALNTSSKSNSSSIDSINQQLDHIVASKINVTGTNTNSFISCPLTKNVHYALIIKEGTVSSNVWLSVSSEDIFKQKLNFVDGVADFICNFDNINYIYNAPATNVTFELTAFESLPELSETVNTLNGDNTNFNNIVYDKHFANDKKSYKGNGTNRYILLSDIGYKKGKVYFIANFIDDGYRIAQSDTDGGQFVYVSPTYVDEATRFGYYNIEKDYIVLTTSFLSAHNIAFIHPIEERINDVENKLDSTKNELMQYTRDYVKVYSHNAICSFVDDDMMSRVATVWGTILNDTGIRAGFACITGKVGTESYATLSDVQTLYNGGNEIYSHSFDHNYAFYENETTPEIIEEECWKSKTWLLNNGFIRNADTIVYPGGMGINTDKEDVIRRHFRYGVNSAEGEAGNADPVNRYFISRVNADTATLEELKGYVDNAITRKRLLVFMTHSELINTNEQIEKIESLIEYIQENNTLILPLREALNQIYGYNN